MSFQISFENDRLHNPYLEAQDFLPSLCSRPTSNLEATLIKASYQVSELRRAQVEVLLQPLEGLRAASGFKNLFELCYPGGGLLA